MSAPELIDLPPSGMRTQPSRQKGRMEQGSGHLKFCWHCSKKLQAAKGKGLGLVYFRTVIDQDGNPHRVHGDCVADAIGDGVKLAQAGAHS